MGARFQFTPLREGRPFPVSESPGVGKISIHAPPRGATSRGRTSATASAYFNSRPSARGDRRQTRPSRRITWRFQFTPLREGRPRAPARQAACTLFQFTPLREGRPDKTRARLLATIYFNSRPSARGDGKRYAISANLLFNPYKSAWLNNSATQFVEIILVIFHRIIA